MTKGGNSGARFLIVYGSQTGQAKAIAEELSETAVSKGFSPALFCFSQFEKKFSFEREKYVVIVTSTTGEGEPPDTVLKFWRRIRRTTLPSDHFANIKYSLLGLGDSNYNNFCVFGKQLDKRFEELGATRFYESRWADDATGLEVEAEPWMDGVLQALSPLLLGTTAPASVTLSLNTFNSHLQSSSQQNLAQEGDTASANNDIHVNPVGPSDMLSSGTNNSLSDQTSRMDSDELLVTGVSNLQVDVTRSPPAGSVVNSETSDIQSLPSVAGVCNTVTSHSSQSAPVPSDNLEPAAVRSLICSLPPLSDAALTVPLCPARFLEVSFLPNDSLDTSDTRIQNGCPFAGAQSSVTSSRVISARRWTSSDVVKKIIEVSLDISESGWSYEPGDSVGVVCTNNASEVEKLIGRLGLSEQGNTVCNLGVIEGTSKRNASVPEHLPQKSTIFRLLLTCCEIREVPPKSFIRALVEFTSDEHERRRLQEICSKQGADDYHLFIRQPSICLLDLLMAFPSCQPPIAVVLEHLPRLLPRPYSVASSPLDTPHKLSFIFNVIEIPGTAGRCEDRRGVCTGWMMDRVLPLLDLDSVEIDIFRRTNNFFRLPNDVHTPIIMVGPGTGVAPFIGFIKHREQLQMCQGDGPSFGETWLFYGCRHRDLDFLYRSEIERWESSGVLTKACVSFSRDVQQQQEPRYVQDNIRKYGKELSALIIDKNAMVYVCGDASGMAPQVCATFKEIIITHQGLDEPTASAHLTTMRLKKRYLEDIWV